MSIITVNNLYCDNCNEPFRDFIAEGFVPAAKQRADAKLHKGWDRVRVGRRWFDVCGSCMGEYDGQNGRGALMRHLAKKHKLPVPQYDES